MKNNSDNRWRGYDLDEIRYRQTLNAIKTDFKKQELQMYLGQVFNPTLNPAATEFAGKLDKYTRWIEYGIIGFNTIRRIRQFFKK